MSFDFEILDDTEFDKILEDNNRPVVRDEKKVSILCKDCNSKLIEDPIKRIKVCDKCGIVEKFTATKLSNNDFMNNYNSLDSSAWLVKVYGKNSYKNNRHLCASNLDYRKMQKYNTRKQLEIINNNSKNCKFSKAILNETAELFYKIQRNETKKIVRRGNGRKGLLGACLDSVLSKNKIARKPREIAKYIGVVEAYISKADKLLHMLHNAGEIELVLEKDEISSFINQYFMILKLDKKYLEFCKSIVKISEESTELKGDNNSRISTKAAGIIYILSTQVSLGINHNDISKKCNISYPTFVRFAKYIERNKDNEQIKQVFKDHNIPLFTVNTKKTKKSKKTKKTKKE